MSLKLRNMEKELDASIDRVTLQGDDEEREWTREEIIEGLQAAIGNCDKLEEFVIELRRHGRLPGNPGDEIPIG